MDLTSDERFFYENAPFSYGKGEAQEQSQVRCARELARAERDGRKAGLSFDWSVDAEVDSSEFSDEMPPWQLWQCVAYDADGTMCASLRAIDFGRDGTPHSSAYRRVVEAQLADEALGELDKATMRDGARPIDERRAAFVRHNQRTARGK